ncbi:MAG: hypothetical protein AAFN93_28570 [Bacteroidota bacterium]
MCTLGLRISKSIIQTFLPAEESIAPKFAAMKVLPSPLIVEVIDMVWTFLPRARKSILVLIVLSASLNADFEFVFTTSFVSGSFSRV